MDYTTTVYFEDKVQIWYLFL